MLSSGRSANVTMIIGNELTFCILFANRYGREDEEVMGLKFCNEAIMSLAQVWPLNCAHEKEPSTALQVRSLVMGNWVNQGCGAKVYI